MGLAAKIEYYSFIRIGETISGGTVEATLKVDGIQVYSGKFDVCDSLKQGNFSCPLPAGNYEVKESTKIPEIVPKVSLPSIS